MKSMEAINPKEVQVRIQKVGIREIRAVIVVIVTKGHKERTDDEM
jgi:hypothetical protein